MTHTYPFFMFTYTSTHLRTKIITIRNFRITKGKLSSGQSLTTMLSGQHRALGSSVSKVRSLTMDNKVWTEPLIQVGIQ